ncbi:MAG: tetrathionate reductase family octaheme c-type cytochrome [Bacteroidales bacterium]|nr:tetrathionate reductase family octaheme c-type cytochrome [Bacteroidales bacterium]
MNNVLQKLTVLLVTLVLPAMVIYFTVFFGLRPNEARKIEYVSKAEHTASVDHSQFDLLQQQFTNPKQVTAACLTCHNKRDDELMQSSHWKWERDAEIPGRGIVKIGKKNLHNNFCTAAEGNNGSCMRCHIGYGWEDKSFDFNDPTNIDCLVCHDKSDTYFKQKGMAGWPATAETATKEFPVPDYNLVSQSVGYPDRDNCGVCHFFGGGGNNVKHGDLEEALFHSTKKVDVHMGEDGRNLVCIDCHRTEKHNIKGRAYSVSAENTNRADCEQCHTSKPHNDVVLDYHNSKVACQTCHIPVYAKVNATTLYWDWSKAGRKDADGNPIKEYDADHNYSYLSIKGHFVFDNMVKPEYYWFNGTADHFLTEDTIREIPVKINKLFGDYKDPNAKIWPVKVHRGKQAFDPVTKQVLSVKLYGKGKGEGAFWEDLDWEEGIRKGMEYKERPWSGQYDFVETEVYWPLNHMVSMKEETLSCKECHTRNEGRLASLNDFYLPGRDYNALIDYTGIGIIIISLIGVLIHTLLRIF